MSALLRHSQDLLGCLTSRLLRICAIHQTCPSILFRELVCNTLEPVSLYFDSNIPSSKLSSPPSMSVTFAPTFTRNLLHLIWKCSKNPSHTKSFLWRSFLSSWRIPSCENSWSSLSKERASSSSNTSTPFNLLSAALIRSTSYGSTTSISASLSCKMSWAKIYTSCTITALFLAQTTQRW